MRWSDGCRPWGCRLNRHRFPRIPDRAGYVSLLAMSFAFGLAVLGTALAVGLRSYLVAAAAQHREILDRITLESAAHEILGRLAAGESHSIKPSKRADIEMNQRRVSVELSLPEGKYDLKAEADREPMIAALGRQAVAGPAQSASLSFYSSIAELSNAWRLTAPREDCLRRVVTVGRAPEAFDPEAAPGGGDELIRIAVAGDQVDVRASLSGASQRVLWTRARFTGSAYEPWRLHDYRSLKFSAAEAPCAQPP